MIKWFKRLSILTVILLALWLLRVYPLRMLGGFLIVQEEPAKAQAIVVLSGESPARMLGSYDLFKKGLSPIILLTRGPHTRAAQLLEGRGITYINQSDFDRQILIKLGVPEAGVMVIPDDVKSTIDEAFAVKAYFQSRYLRKLLLVTSRYHSRRAKKIFEHVFAGTADIVSVPTPYDDFESHDWWQNRENVKQVLVEYQKLFWYSGVFFWEFLGEVWSYPSKVKEGRPI